MSILSNQSLRPIEVSAPLADSDAGAPVGARVCALIVTWNRKGFLTTVLKALSVQTYSPELLDVVVIDNAGSDGTLEFLESEFRPERIVENHTEVAHEPKFGAPRLTSPRNTLGFSSLTVIRNRANVGGCGGFNTGFASVERLFGDGEHPAPSFVWLVDDDVDLPPNALANLVEAMESDPHIGLVGSRTCDIANRGRTIETTIYFNTETGAMQDDAPPGHRRHEAHRAWVATVGGPRGQGGATGYRGLMDVDVVSACSMLARWKAVVGDGERRGVGFWDHRYFIYCDDADWCLRVARAGWRVVLNLDAVVFHTPWNLKLTPARIYYANRNRLWMVQKTLPTERLREVTRRMMRSFLFDGLHAALHRRLFHAHIILQTGLDAARNVGGKTGSDGPTPVPIVEALRTAGCLDGAARVAVVCNVGDSLAWMNDLRDRVAGALRSGEAAPVWLPIARNDVPNPPAGAIIYGRHLASRLKKQLWAMVRRPRAVVVFDQINDFPVLFAAPWTLHVDHKKPEVAQVERDGWGKRLGFGVRWAWTGVVFMRYARSVKPFVSETRYG